jgi:sugar/nucleoside kinase (ribokinase family)
MIDYLAIGHIAADLQPDGSYRLGGTALFAAIAAHRLGLRAAIVTACAPELDLSSLPEDLLVLRQPSQATTVFENRYTDTGRVQLVHARAATIELGPHAEQLPPEWRRAPIVHLAPIIQEISPACAESFPSALVGATPQGWLRSIQPSGLVETHPGELLALPWRATHVAVFSEEDVGFDDALVHRLAQRLPLLAYTRAERGATIFIDGRAHDVPAYPAAVTDPTGAGDVFAAAFLAALQRSDDALAAARWANAAASWAIEGPGITALPTSQQVRERMTSAEC